MITGIAVTLSLFACGQLNRYTEPEGDVDVRPVAEIEDTDPVAEPEPEPEPESPIDGDGDGVLRNDDCDDDDRDVYPGAADTCGDDVDSDCDGEDCDDWEDGFESGSFDPDWRTRGDAEWSASRAVVHTGVWAAESGNVRDLETSFLTLEVDTPAGGTISFWHSGSTEEAYDFLTFSVDDVVVGAWSGEWDYQRETFTLADGGHTLQWVYDKDFSESVGDDRVWLDDLKIVGGGP